MSAAQADGAEGQSCADDSSEAGSPEGGRRRGQKQKREKQQVDLLDIMGDGSDSAAGSGADGAVERRAEPVSLLDADNIALVAHPGGFLDTFCSKVGVLDTCIRSCVVKLTLNLRHDHISAV